MASSTFAKIACIVVIAMVVAAPTADAINCGTVTSELTPCIRYVRSKGGNVPPACCNGIKILNGLAKTPQDRRTACRCLKTAVNAIKRPNWVHVAGLPGKCGVNIRINVGPATDCSKVN